MKSCFKLKRKIMNLRLKKYKFISIERDVKLQIDYVSSYNFTVIIITTEIHYI